MSKRNPCPQAMPGRGTLFRFLTLALLPLGSCFGLSGLPNFFSPNLHLHPARMFGSFCEGLPGLCLDVLYFRGVRNEVGVEGGEGGGRKLIRRRNCLSQCLAFKILFLFMCTSAS